MKLQPDSAFLALICAAALSSFSYPIVAATPDDTQALAVPADQALAFEVMASGVRVYECMKVSDSASKFEWVFKAPEAELYDANGNGVGHFYVGPTWEAYDGSKVVGEVKGKYPDLDAAAISLLPSSKSNAGKGVFAQSISVRPLRTKGWQAPTESCNQAQTGKESRVPFTANYSFSTARMNEPAQQKYMPHVSQSIMPINVAKTVRIFKMTESGGVQRVIVKNRDDADQVTLIQQNLREEADRFQHGDYSDFAALHRTDKPEPKDIQPGAQQAKVSYATLSDGAEIIFETTDLHLLTAIHRWFGSQLSEYGADAKAE